MTGALILLDLCPYKKGGTELSSSLSLNARHKERPHEDQCQDSHAPARNGVCSRSPVVDVSAPRCEKQTPTSEAQRKLCCSVLVARLTRTGLSEELLGVLSGTVPSRNPRLPGTSE